MSPEIEQLKHEIEVLKKRNKRVELDKAWETSRTRWVSVIVITYLLTLIVFYLINVPKPFLNALIPTLGYFLSVQSLPFVKYFWIRRRK